MKPRTFGDKPVNTAMHTAVNRRRTLVATTVAFTLMVAFTTVPIGAEGSAAAQPAVDGELRAHRIYLAGRKVGTAKLLAEQRGLQRQSDPQEPTDHGLVLTLGDVLFRSGRADLPAGALGNLNKLVDFLDQYPDRRVAIQGHTDSRGGAEYNQGLSERRANSVRAYLADHVIDSTRLCASGIGQSAPVAGNDSGAGRQQNRRVEVIISDPPISATQRARTAKIIVMLALFESVSGSPARPLL
jgi:outer membrane protein OmpA-like peptidoglycan-associated protein